MALRKSLRVFPCKCRRRWFTATAGTKHTVSALPGRLEWRIMADSLPKPPRPIAAVLFVLGLLAAEGVLFASERFKWFDFNHEKGLTVLLAVVLVGVAAMAFFVWIGISRLFGWQTQFGLGTVFLLVGLVALPSAWLGSEFRRAQAQAALVKSILAEGGTVEYFEFSDPRRRRWSPDGDLRTDELSRVETGPLAFILGVDFFRDVIRVSVETTHAVDQLHYFPHLKNLSMAPGTTDLDIEKLASLRELELIDLSGTAISDDSLIRLAAMPELRWLNLTATKTTDKALKHLSSRERAVRVIWIDDTDMTEFGVAAYLQKFPEAVVLKGNRAIQRPAQYTPPSDSSPN